MEGKKIIISTIIEGRDVCLSENNTFIHSFLPTFYMKEIPLLEDLRGNKRELERILNVKEVFGSESIVVEDKKIPNNNIKAPRTWGQTEMYLQLPIEGE